MIDLTKLGTITSYFGRRDAPKKGASTDHKGLDIVLASDKIPAITSGRVTAKGHNASEGNYVTFATPDGTNVTYMHMATSSPLAIGDPVLEGQSVGTQGSTGISTGKHLDVRIKKDGNYVDPLSFMRHGPSSGNGDSWLEWIKNPAAEINKNLLTVALMLFVGYLAFNFFMKFLSNTKTITLSKGASK